MNNPIFEGVCTAMVTPFCGNDINYAMMDTLLNRQLEAQIPAAVICGTTGEAPTLTDREKICLIRHCCASTRGKMSIIAGTGSNCTSHAIELSIAAEEAGANALLVVSPYYNKTTQDGLILHYLSIARSVNVPLILYNVPGRTGMDIPVAVYEQLCKQPNIVGVKEASNSIEKIIDIRSSCGEDFCIWTGNDRMTVPVMSLGGRGVISVASNVCPKQMRQLTSAALRGDFEKAALLQLELSRIMQLMFFQVNPIPVKAAMNIIGYDCGACRPPLTTFSQSELNKMAQVLKNVLPE